jgi:XapX domain-containing protein
MTVAVVALALCTGLLAGALFAFLRIPVPAPPNLAGVMGIVGIYLGYKVVNWLGAGIDLLGALGIEA